jgi:hypothetical protein
MPDDRHPASPGFATKHLRWWIESDRIPWNVGAWPPDLRQDVHLEPAPVVRASVLGGFADLRSLDVKDAEQLPSPRHPVTTFSTLSAPYVDGNTAIRARLFAMPDCTSTWRFPALN